MTELSKIRFYTGSIIFTLGFASPLFIPLVTNSNLSLAWKSGLSGLLALGIPELFMIVAVAIMGKSGYEYLKSKIARFLKPLAPPDSVSLIRYRIGLFMFILPLLAGWLQPYLSYFIPFFKEVPLGYLICGDVIFFLSFFVLGGNFWDKFSALFKHQKT